MKEKYEKLLREQNHCNGCQEYKVKIESLNKEINLLLIDMEIKRKEIKSLQDKQQLLKKGESKRVKRLVFEILSPIFSKGQIKKLLNRNRSRINWDADDIAAAISLRTVSPACYRFLRKKGYPLPNLSTLRRKAANIILQEGVISQVLSVMKKRQAL